MGNQQTGEQVSIDDLNLETDKWVTSMKGMTRDRQANIRQDVSAILANKSCICSPLGEQGDVPPGCFPIKINNRLGTPSMDGEVYLLQIGDVKMAGKVMPVINDKSEQKNTNEIKIATFLSNIVKEGKSLFFPIVYGSALCTKTTFSNNSKFKKESDRYALIRNIIKQLEGDRRKQVRFNAYTKSGKLDTHEDIIAFVKSYDIEIPDKIQGTSYIMLSELAWGDLGDFFIKYGDKIGYKMWNKLILQSLYAIRDLHVLGIAHNDLHIHNMLIMFEQKNGKIEFLPLIHDFGKSEIVENWTMEMRKKDYESIINGLIEKSDYYNVPSNMKTKLLKIQRILENYSSIGPIEKDLLKFWKKE